MSTWPSLLARAIDRLRTEPSTDIAASMADEIMDMQHAEPWADAVIRGSVREHCLKKLNEAHKDLTSLDVITRDGRRRKVNSSVAEQKRDAGSGNIIGVQRRDWWGYDLAQLESHLDTVLRERREVADRVEVLQNVVRAMRAHPECATAAAAWQAEGRSLDEIDLSA